MGKLAINGGKKIREELFPAYMHIDQKEIDAVAEVLKSGVLSNFIGGWHENFRGGIQVRSLEEEWADHFKVKNALAVNSASSGLIAALGAISIEPGDEVIVTPYSMTISATAPLFYGAVPVFADIDPVSFNLSLETIKEKVTDKTKAIIVVDLFGNPYDYMKINAFAKEKGIKIIEDAAQAPNAMIDKKYAGTLGDIGVYSLNYHKHIHSGEGGLVVTNDDDLAFRIAMIRNHAEAVADGLGYENLTNMVGYNFRMTELEAAVARVQLNKLGHLADDRINNVEYLNKRLGAFDFLTPSEARDGTKHVFYKHAIKFDVEKAGVSRNKFFEAVKAELTPIRLRENEGVNISCGYVKPIHLLPMFQKKIAFGSKGFPFISPFNAREYTYDKGLCPVCEDMHFNKLVSHEYMRPPMSKKDLDDFIDAIAKVQENIEELR